MVQPEMTGEKVSLGQESTGSATPVMEYVAAMYFTALVTGASFVIEPLAGYRAIALLYLLLVVALGIKLRRGPVLLAAASSALAWDFFFIPTRLSLHIANIEDLMMFAMFFVVAMAMGHLTSRLRLNEMAERTRAQRTAALYELVHQAGLAPDLDAGLRATISLTETLFGVRASLLLRLPDHSLATESHPASSFSLDKKEYRVAVWAFSHRMSAGKFTDNRPESEAVHLPLQARADVMGVLSIYPLSGTILGPAEIELLEAFAMLIGTILEKDHLLQGVKRAEILSVSERLQRALLQSVSHELKTPLSAVQAGADALAKETGNNERSQTTLREIQQALRRLHRVINNLLDMTRIESGVIHPKLDWCDTRELIQAAVDLAADGIRDHTVSIEADVNLPIVKVDQALLEQSLCNLLLNAASNSKPKAKIIIGARFADGRLILSVLDEGKGIRELDLPHIFETFHRGADASPGGTGLGLAIVDGFVRAHGGSVTAVNRLPRGAEFVMTIPVETLRPDLLESFA
jgi:two-component system, OmpR family, sensor histidine kinase KdpD